MSVRLESWYLPAASGPGSMRLRLVNAGPTTVEEGFELTFTTVVQVEPVAPAVLVRRTSGAHVVAPSGDVRLVPGATWEFVATCGHRPAHANDGPESAYLCTADGSIRPVRTAATAIVDVVRAEAPTYRPVDATGAWTAVESRDRRLHPHDVPVLSPTGEHPVSLGIDRALRPDEHVVRSDDAELRLSAGSDVGLQRGLTALVSGARSGEPVPVGRHTPLYDWRGLHIDLARQFFPAPDVAWLIDVASWHGLNRLHLHLTDDEGWRVPVDGYPALTDVGAWRGEGLPIPALLGSGSEPYGGAYERDEIAAWVTAASEAGVAIVPEIDLPGHCFAALAAYPELADLDDASGAVSVQSFVDNVLNPGVPGTRPFVEAVFGSVADLFPSPWLHIGGDEVPHGAWRGSPAARRYAAERGLASSAAIASTFVRDLIDLVVSTTGRRVGAWQEAADSGALRPADGYVVGWKSAPDCQRLAADGYHVVASPAEMYYLDMAATTDWHAPGMSWAGHSSVTDIEGFDVTAGWSAAERESLLGIQACVWTEHARDRPTLERLLFPRLTAIAESAWRRM